jgi:ubiquinone/menaquinone biosynthesis C-methylase UbiE
MSHILKIAKNLGYRTALNYVVYRYPSLGSYVTSYLRIDWLFHCYDLDHKQRCLDLGSGWGAISFPLTSFFDEVVSLERVSLRMEFQKNRAREDDAETIRFVAADMLSLPFRENQFDLVAANGVLEWTAFSHSDNPRSLQLRFLREIRRCLKSGGCLYIGIENRFGLNYLLGAKDHTSLRFTGILPRRISNLIVSRLLREEGWSRYHTYTYSIKGYTSLLEEAGFGEVRSYWVYPSYNYPKFAGELHDGNGYSFLAQHHLTNYPDMPLPKRFLAFLASLTPSAVLAAMCPLVWPNFLIFAWKDSKPTTFDTAIAGAAHAESLVRMSGGDGPSSKITFVALDGSKPLSFSKISRDLGTQKLEIEEQLASTYTGVAPTRDTYKHVAFFREPAILGRPCSFHSKEDNKKAIHWLLRFQDETALEPLSEAETAQEQSEILSSLPQIYHVDLPPTKFADQLKELARILSTMRVIRCSEHGDFWPANILFSNTGGVLVLDWEFYKVSGNPLFDFCFFLINVASRPSGELSFSKNFLGTGDYSGILRENVRTFCSHRRVPVRSVLLGISYALLRCLGRYSVFSETCSPVLARRYSSLLTTWNDEIFNSDLAWLGEQVTEVRMD